MNQDRLSIRYVDGIVFGKSWARVFHNRSNIVHQRWYMFEISVLVPVEWR
jgi:hypothetical protein